MNKIWHKTNTLGQNAPMKKRLAWHVAHQKHCGCRPLPKSIQSESGNKKGKIGYQTRPNTQ